MTQYYVTLSEGKTALLAFPYTPFPYYKHYREVLLKVLLISSTMSVRFHCYSINNNAIWDRGAYHPQPAALPRSW